MLCFILGLAPKLYAQEIIGFSSVFDDSFREWKVITADEDDFDGELALTFGGVDNTFDDWTYDVGEYSGSIRQKFKGDDRLWVLDADGRTISIERVWPGDNREWTIRDGRLRKTIRTRYGNSGDEWRLSDDKDGYFDIYTLYQGDARDWEISTTLSNEYDEHFIMALSFIVLYASTPKI